MLKALMIRVNVIALVVVVSLLFGAGPGEASEVSNAEILKRLEAMGQQIQAMDAEIKTLKQENKELKAELKQVSPGQADHQPVVAATGAEGPPVNMTPLIADKPFEGGLQVDAELLQLTVDQDSVAYAGYLSDYTGITASIDAGQNTEFDENTAWRFGLSYIGPTGWDGGLKYMHFNTSGDSSLGERGVDNNNVWVNHLDRSLADDVLNYNFDDGVADYAAQKLKIGFDVWDAELGHTFRTSDDTALRLFGGLRHVDLNNDSTIQYENWEGALHQVALIEDRLDVEGYGARIGGSVMWDIYDTGLSVNFGSAFSLVYADFDLSRSDNYQSGATTGTRSITSDTESLLPIVDINLGLKYRYQSFFVEGGYLLSYWFNGDRQYQVVGHDDVDGTTSPYGYEKSDISFHGWTLKAGIVF